MTLAKSISQVDLTGVRLLSSVREFKVFSVRNVVLRKRPLFLRD